MASLPKTKNLIILATAGLLTTAAIWGGLKHSVSSPPSSHTAVSEASQQHSGTSADSQGKPLAAGDDAAPISIPPPSFGRSQNPEAQALPPGYRERVYRAFYKPNDQRADQWHYQTIKAPAMWDYTVGNPNIKVAVIDTGIALEHEDLWQRWFTNGGESGQTASGERCWTGSPQNKTANNCDDDNNGYIDDYRGWDFINHDNRPVPGDDHDPYADGAFHGTAVTGLIGSTGNNGLGAAGLNWQAQLIPIQVLDDYGYGFTSDVLAAINYAVAMEADVINLSLGSEEPDPVLRDAILNAVQSGAVVVAAAGNDGCNCLSYPANYPEVIAVGASENDDTRAEFSSYGANLDVIAPGVDNMLTLSWEHNNPTAAYVDDAEGTSFAAPLVSGLVATIKGIAPHLTVDQVVNLLRSSADKVAEMNGQLLTLQHGHGRINTEAAVKTLNLSVSPPPLPTVPLFRLYKASTGQEVYTTSLDRKEELIRAGYTAELIKFPLQ